MESIDDRLLYIFKGYKNILTPDLTRDLAYIQSVASSIITTINKWENGEH